MRYVNVIGVVGAAVLAVVVNAPVQAQAAAKPPVMTHTAAGRDNCLMCHSGSMPNVAGVPASHEGRTNETCKWCHAADAEVQTKAVPAVSHALEGRANCMMCHKAGTMEAVPDAPASHEGRDVKWCTMCHTKG
jgi:hypothetical protein